MTDHVREIVAACYGLGSVCFLLGTVISYVWGR